MPNVTGEEYYEFDPFGGLGGDASQIVAPEEGMPLPIPDLQPDEVAQFNQWAKENPTFFIEKAQQWGRSRELEAVMRGNGMSNQDIDNIFEPANNVYAMEQLRDKVQQNVRATFEEKLAQGIAMDERDWNTFRDFYSQNIFDGIGKDGYENQFVKDLMTKSQTFRRFFEAAKGEGYKLDELTVQRNGRFIMDFVDTRGRGQTKLAHYPDGNVKYTYVYVNPNTGKEIDKEAYDKMDGSIEQGFYQEMRTPVFDYPETDRSGKWMYDPQERTFVKLGKGYSSTRYSADDVRLDNGLFVGRQGMTHNDLYNDYMRNSDKWEIDANGVLFGNGMRMTDREALALLNRDLARERRGYNLAKRMEDPVLKYDLIDFARDMGYKWEDVASSWGDLYNALNEKGVSLDYKYKDSTEPIDKDTYNKYFGEKETWKDYSSESFWGNLLTNVSNVNDIAEQINRYNPAIILGYAALEAAAWPFRAASAEMSAGRIVAPDLYDEVSTALIASGSPALQEMYMDTGSTPAVPFLDSSFLEKANRLNEITSQFRKDTSISDMIKLYEEKIPIGDRIMTEIVLSLPLFLVPVSESIQAVKVAQATSRFKSAEAGLRAVTSESTFAEIAAGAKLSQGSPFVKPAAEYSAALRNLRLAKINMAKQIRYIQSNEKMAYESLEKVRSLQKEWRVLKDNVVAGKRGGVKADDVEKLMELRQNIHDEMKRGYTYMLGKSEQEVNKLVDNMLYVTRRNESELAEFVTMAEKEGTVFTDDSMRRIGERLSSSEATEWLVQAVMPAGKSSLTQVRRGAFMLGMMKAEGKSLTAIELSGWNIIPRDFEVIMSGAKQGMVKNVEHIGGKLDAQYEVYANHIIRVFENPDEYIFTKGALKGKSIRSSKDWRIWNEINDKKLRLLERKGIDFKQLELDPGQHYFHHATRGVKPADMQKTREIKDVAVGLAQGVKYQWDYRAIGHKVINDTYDILARSEFVNYIKSMGTDIGAARFSELQSRVSALSKASDQLSMFADEVRLTGTVQDVTGLQRLSRNVAKSIRDKEPVEQTLHKINLRQKTYAKSIASANKESSGIKKGISGIKGTEGLEFRAESAKEIADALAPYRTGWDSKGITGTALEGLSAVQQLMRTAITAYDFGAPMIHGLPVLGAHPEMWAKGWVNMWRATWNKGGVFHNDTWMAGYLNQNKQYAIDAVRKGYMIFDSSEFMEGAGLIKKIPIVGATVKPFERAFTSFLDTTRLELWKGMYRPNMTAKQAMDTGNYIDKLLGSVHASKMGIKANQSMVETLMFFAPRYYRSQISLMTDAVSGGLRGGHALRAIALNHAAHDMAYMGICEVLGQEPILDPTDTRYRKFKLEDTWIGEAGFARGMTVLMGRMASEIANKQPERILYRLARFGQGKLSRMAGMATNIAAGKNFLQEGYGSLDGLFGVDWGKMAGNELVMQNLPFFVQAFFTDMPDYSMKDRLIGAGFELAGLSTMPDQNYLRTHDYLERESQNRHGLTWRELQANYAEDAINIMSTPEYQELARANEEDRDKKGASYRERGKLEMIEFAPYRNRASDKRTDELNTIYDMYHDGEMGFGELGERRNAAEKEYSDTMKDLYIKYPNVYKDIQKYDRNLDAMSKEVREYVVYKDEVLYNERLYDDAFQAKLDSMSEDDRNIAFFKMYDEVQSDYISKYGMESYEHSRGLALKDKGFNDAYISYKVDMDVVSMTRDKVTGKGYWDYVQDKDREGKMDFLFENPKIEANLYVHGYISSVQTLEAYDLAMGKIIDLGMNKGVPLPLDRKESGAPQYMYDRLNELKSTTGKGVERSEYAVTMTDKWFDVTNRIYALEDAASLAKTEEQKEQIINDLYSAIAQASSLTSELNSSGKTEPYIELLKQRMAIFERENRTRISRIT